MRYHNITKDDMLNGDGLRVVLWVAGSPVYLNPQGKITFELSFSTVHVFKVANSSSESILHLYISPFRYTNKPIKQIINTRIRNIYLLLSFLSLFIVFIPFYHIR